MSCGIILTIDLHSLAIGRDATNTRAPLRRVAQDPKPNLQNMRNTVLARGTTGPFRTFTYGYMRQQESEATHCYARVYDNRWLFVMNWKGGRGGNDVWYADVNCSLSRISKMSVRPLSHLTLHFLGRRSVTIVKSVEFRLPRRIERIGYEKVSAFGEHWFVALLGIDAAYRPTIVHCFHLVSMCKGRHP